MNHKKISLHGNWTFELDDNNQGEKEGWFQQGFDQIIHLPGSLDEAGVGPEVTTIDTYRLSRKHKYVGAAWYNRSIELPEDIGEKHTSLILERCMWKSEVWINGVYVGSEDSLCTPHQYHLDGFLAMGENLISIRIDNTPQYDLGMVTHAYSEEVQSIWNGIIGNMELVIQEPFYIDGIQIYPNLQLGTAMVKMALVNSTEETHEGTLNLHIMNQVKEVIHEWSKRVVANGKDTFSFEEDLILDNLQPWDEFEPNVYTLTAELSYNSANLTHIASKTIAFGMREFKAQGPVFKMNGRTIFLRGTMDAGNFPLTGYPSMKGEDWLRIFKIAKSYGLNHVRFHSWCPPEAAFDAADALGVILQAELPLFGYSAVPLGEDVQRDEFLERELYRILDVYGNHPSFCLMCMGNELRGDYVVLEKLVELGKSLDKRHLYCASANNAAEPSVGIKPNPGDEFYVAHEARILGERVMRRCEEVFNQERPETLGDYHETLVGIEVPTVSHEVGQWLVYPNYDEIKKYTGVLQARNLETFQTSMAAQGLTYQANNFLNASGKLVVQLYKEEIERSLRTPDYGGFQLLDLHDFPGQGTSLVGWLDTFWDSKGFIEPETFRSCCHHTVVLARMEKRVWQSDEEFSAVLELANYSRQDYLNLKVHWSLTDSNRKVIGQGVLKSERVEQGSLSILGQIETSLNEVPVAEKCTLEVKLNGLNIENQWDIWVYPAIFSIEVPEGVFITDCWDETVENKLELGESVLLLTHDIVSEEAMRFTPPFWNTQLFDNQRKTMGILCDPTHPIFTDFPTDNHTNWQWWELLADSRCIKLNTLPEALEPLVWAIDHPVRNLKLGVVFEASVGSGKLLVCSLDLRTDLEHRLVARQLKHSLNRYMVGESFRPKQDLSVEQARALFEKHRDTQLHQLTKQIKASNTKWSSNIENILTSDPGDHWVTYDGQYPYTIEIELHESVGISGFKVLPRQDGMQDGFICDYEIYVGNDIEVMGKPVAKGRLLNSIEEQTILFDFMDDGFNVTRRKAGKYIRFVAVNGHGGNNDAAIARLEIIVI